jgi:hypothetical protein
VSKSTAIIFARAGRRFIQPRPLTLFGEPIEWVETTRYLGLTLYTRLTWSPHIDQVRKRSAQRLGMLSPFLNRKSDLSIRNGVLLYKQLVRPMMDYACPAWRSAARGHVRKLRVVPSVQQKSSGLKFSKSRTRSDVTYSCHHNSSCFTFPIFVHSWRFFLFHLLQSITPRVY